LASIYARDAFNELKVKQAKMLLMRSLKLAIEANNQKLEICVYINLSAVLNELELFHKSIHIIQLAYDKLNIGKKFLK
jgi:hypothetical protein